MHDPEIVNNARGEYVIEGKTGEYPVAYTLRAFEEFERKTGKAPMSIMAAVHEIVEVHEIDIDNLGAVESMTMTRLLGVMVGDIVQMLRCGMIGYAGHAKSRGEPKLGDDRMEQIVADCGGVMGVFSQVVAIWARSSTLMGEYATMNDEDTDDDTDADPDPQ